MIQKPNLYMFLDQLARMVVEHGLMALVKKAGTLGIAKYNWKTRLSQNVDNGEWCTQFLGYLMKIQFFIGQSIYLTLTLRKVFHH
jgi:hypothetical protein